MCLTLPRIAAGLCGGLFAALCILLSGGCTKNPNPPMRVGVSTWTGYEPFYLARAKGYFDSARIRLVSYTSVTQSARAFRNGAIDAAAITLDEAIKLYTAGIDLTVVLVIDFSNGGDVVLARPEYAQLSELKDKRVGVETTSLGDFVLGRALNLSGMTDADVQVVPLDVFEHERAYKEGRVDAVVTYEPVRTRLLAVGARKLFDSSQIPGEIVDVLVVNRTFLKDGESQIEELLRGWFKALSGVKGRNKLDMEAMAKRENLTGAEFTASLDGLMFPSLEENRDALSAPSKKLLASVRLITDELKKDGLLKGDRQDDLLLDGAFVERLGQ